MPPHPLDFRPIKKPMAISVSTNLQILPDPNGLAPVDSLLPALMDAAHKKGIKVALHIEPYTGRSVKTLNKDLR